MGQDRALAACRSGLGDDGLRATLPYLQLASLWFTLHAFGAPVGIAVMGAVLFGGRAIGGAAPTPGGVGAVEAALIGGLAGAGVDPAIATPATLVFRLLANWAVVVPGWFALRTVCKRHAL